jgi:predicted RNA binding protein YcfA (HicA-like mRNA interferase family)
MEGETTFSCRHGLVRLDCYRGRGDCRCATAQRAQCADENLRTLEKTGWLHVWTVSRSADLLEDSGMSTLRLKGSHFVY